MHATAFDTGDAALTRGARGAPTQAASKHAAATIDPARTIPTSRRLADDLRSAATPYFVRHVLVPHDVTGLVARRF